MAIQIYTSSKIDTLSLKLAENISASTNVFIPDYVVTSNSGLNNWVKIQLATQNGIASNLRFVKNNDIIDIAYSVLNEKQSDKTIVNSSLLLWLIYEELGDSTFLNKFTEIADYCTEDVLKRHGLALKLTQLFEDYQIYITDEFDNGALDDFQKYIWAQIKTKIATHYLTKREVKNQITELLNSEQKQELITDKLPNIHLFLGVDSTAYHLDIFNKLAEYININFYLFNPTSKKEIQNSLVENWGKVLLTMPFDLSKAINLDENIKLNESNSLLHKIQNNIYQNNPKANNFIVDDLKDNSITINNCYTTTREVEVLYNYIVKTIDESNGELGARDFLVQASNIDDYSSAINSVFSTGPFKIPFSISDKSYATTNSVYNAIEALFNLDTDYKSESIIQLLEFSSIREKFEIYDIDLIRNLVNEANIRFGAKGDSAIETDSVSWLNGLNRLIYGLCIGDNDSFEFNNGTEVNQGYSVDVVEGREGNELINLHYFFTKISEWIEALNASKSLADWHLLIDKLVDNFIETDKHDEISVFKKNCSTLSSSNEFVTDNVEYSVIREFVLNILSEQQSRSSFASKGITFCSMTQMRSVPYKIVILLGANLNAFPRKDKKVSYNLLNNYPSLNKPSLKEQDKYLFFQLLMSAKQKLYISYIGKDIKTNVTLPPSALVDDLCDYIYENTTNFNSEKDALILEHPLHGFSSKYNNKDDKYYSYLLNKKEKKSDKKQNVKADTTKDSNEIDVKDFVSFFKNPFKFYYNKILGVYYYEGKELLHDSELFELDSLQNWSVKSKLLYQNSVDVDELRAEFVKKGELPLKNMGLKVLLSNVKEINDLKEKFIDLKDAKKERIIQIDYPINDKLLVGQVGSVYGEKYIFPCVSKKSTNFKYIIEFQIKKIILAAVGEELVSNFISIDIVNDKIVNHDNITQIEAQNKLKKLYEFYKQGQKEILPFIGEFGEILMNKEIDIIDKELDKKVNDEYNNKYTDQSIIKEYKTNFFSIEILKELKENTKSILIDILGIKL